MAEPRKLRYVGPHDEVSVPALGKSVRRNHQVEVEDAAVAKSLLEQDTWEEVGAKAKASKADAERADAPKSGG